VPWLGEPSFRGPFGVSLAFHVGVFAFFALLALIPAGRTRYAPAYVVDLVSFPSAPPSATASPAPQAAAPTPAPEVMRVPPSPSASAGRPQPVLLPVKASSPDREELAAAERRRKREELEKTIAAQAKKIASANLKAALPTALPRLVGPVKPISPAAPAGGAAPANIDLRLKSYYDRVWEKVRNSWVLPQGVGADNPSLLAVVGLRILPGGQIEKVWLEQGSGNIYYDQSALRAAQKAGPLPPLPAEQGGGALEVGVNFRPTE
jgi:TonB family protein